MTIQEILNLKIIVTNDTKVISKEIAKDVAFEIANDKIALVEVLNQMSPEMIGKLKNFYIQEYGRD